MEYHNLVDKINDVITNTRCLVQTSMGTSTAEISLRDNCIVIQSEKLNDYLEEYSLE